MANLLLLHLGHEFLGYIPSFPTTPESYLTLLTKEEESDYHICPTYVHHVPLYTNKVVT